MLFSIFYSNYFVNNQCFFLISPYILFVFKFPAKYLIKYGYLHVNVSNKKIIKTKKFRIVFLENYYQRVGRNKKLRKQGQLLKSVRKKQKLTLKVQLIKTQKTSDHNFCSFLLKNYFIKCLSCTLKRLY